MEDDKLVKIARQVIYLQEKHRLTKEEIEPKDWNASEEATRHGPRIKN
jgi:hypothetical protein